MGIKQVSGRGLFSLSGGTLYDRKLRWVIKVLITDTKANVGSEIGGGAGLGRRRCTYTDGLERERVRMGFSRVSILPPVTPQEDILDAASAKLTTCATN